MSSYLFEQWFLPYVNFHLAQPAQGLRLAKVLPSSGRMAAYLLLAILRADQ